MFGACRTHCIVISQRAVDNAILYLRSDPVGAVDCLLDTAAGDAMAVAVKSYVVGLNVNAGGRGTDITCEEIIAGRGDRPATR